MTACNVETKMNGINTLETEEYGLLNNVDRKDESTIESNENFLDNPTLKKYLPKELCAVLDQWFSDGTLDENQKEIFRVSAEFLLQSTKTDTIARLWMNEQTELIELTEKCLNEIASYGYYIGIGGVEDTSLQSLDWLVEAFENARCKQLLDILVKCVTSRYYVDALRRLNDPIASSLTITQEFLLITCPKYIVTCDKDTTYSCRISSKMLHQYDELLADFLPHIDKWTSPVMSCLFYPMKFILPNIRSLSYEQRKPMYQIILILLLHIQASESNTDEGRVKMIYTSLCILIEIIRWDRILSNQLKNKAEEKADLIKILNGLSKNESNEQIELKALELVSLLVPEEEFRKENSTERVTGLFVKNFNDAIRDGKDNRAQTVLKGFKDLVQSDDVKEEILKQNALPSLIKFAKQRVDDPVPLEVVYAMTFNKEANQLIREDTEFVDHIKELRNSDITAVSKVAHGIVWKIEGEEKFRHDKEKKVKQTEVKGEEKSKEEKPEGDDTEEKTNMYDMMISYSWAQKPLCHKINDRLEQDGYKVWLDRDEMRGSIIESMAEAIENSRFVLIGMSSNYKKSTNCKAEAEYAFSRHSKIIPLIVEPDYKADGWLGFLAGSKIYINFADKEGEEFDKAYDLLIEELKRNGLDDKDKPEEKKTDPGTSSTQPKPEEPKPEEPKPTEEPPQEPEQPVIQTREYLNHPIATSWNDQNVLEFLVDNRLDQLIPICESMDGEDLIELHGSCANKPEIMHALFNNSKEQNTVSVNTLFKFISKLRKYLPPKPERKVYFQYKFLPVESNENGATTKDNKNTL